MRLGERWRLRFVFGALGTVPLFLTGWLGYLQVLQAGELPRGDRPPLPLVAATAARQGASVEVLPQPRGTILDRNGSLLALDREVYEVRARIAVPRDHQRTVLGCLGYLSALADDLARAVAAEPSLADRGAAEREHARRFAELFAREFGTPALAGIADPATAPLPKGQATAADVRLLGGVDTLAVIDALRELDDRRSSISLDFLRSYERAYPERELTHGSVGHVETTWRTDGNGRRLGLQTVGVCGLEALPELAAGQAERRSFRSDGRRRPYFLEPLEEVAPPAVLHSTLDLDLQRVAQRELAEQCERGAREGTVTIPKWGALVLVEVETGDVLAAASWHRDAKHPEAASWTPFQSLYEPGSIVKPLVFAFALEQGTLDWDHVYDCAPGSSDYGTRIGSLGRRKPVRDDHACGLLTPHGILVNSSNIGATYVGLGLDREQWFAYMRFYGFGASLGLQLPHERLGGESRRSFDPQVTVRSFRANSAVSFSFGYEFMANALQVARAYLRLFRGGGSELRLCRGVEVDGQWRPAPVSPAGAKFSPRAIDAVRAAMVDVVGDDPHATGHFLHERLLKEEGIDVHGLIGGKTGTAASDVFIEGRGKVNVRNASFVGFLPVEAPRWLAVCVMQKDDDARFYGGSYAAPPAARLLLQARSLAERRLLQQESRGAADGQVRSAVATPGDSGWGRGAPGTTSAGR